MPSTLITTFITGALLLCCAPSLAAATVRTSFLVERAALQDTLAVLRSGGCTEEATGTFRRAVERYTSSTFAFDFGKFPKSREGFYEFESLSALVAALPHQLADTLHA